MDPGVAEPEPTPGTSCSLQEHVGSYIGYGFHRGSLRTIPSLKKSQRPSDLINDGTAWFFCCNPLEVTILLMKDGGEIKHKGGARKNDC